MYLAINKLANSVDLDKAAHDEPSHLDLHCLHRYVFVPVYRVEWFKLFPTKKKYECLSINDQKENL